MSRVVRSMARAVAATAVIVMSETRHNPTTAALKSLALAKSEVSLIGERRTGHGSVAEERHCAEAVHDARAAANQDECLSPTGDARRADRHEPDPQLLDADYVEQARRSMDVAWQIVSAEDGWRKEAGDDEDGGGVVYSKHDPRFGKVFKLVANVDASAEVVYRDTVENFEQSVQWNPTVIHLRVLQRSRLQRADVCYAVAAKGAGGLVASRDFVYVRHWTKREGWYVTSCQSIDYRDQSSLDDESARRMLRGDAGEVVRGVNGPGCMRFRPLAPGKCRYEWLCNTNLKGWLPQWLTDKALSGVQLSFLAGLRRHCCKLAESNS